MGECYPFGSSSRYFDFIIHNKHGFEITEDNVTSEFDINKYQKPYSLWK